MPRGDGFTDAQRASLAAWVRSTERTTGLHLLLHVGRLVGGRADADALLASRGAEADRSVVVAVDPTARSLEIVTGTRAKAVLDDRTCALAALAMTSSFAAGDLVGGIRNGLQILTDHATTAPVVHLDTF